MNWKFDIIHFEIGLVIKVDGLHVFISWCVCLLEEFTGVSFMCVHIPVTVLFPVLLFQHKVHRAVINLKIKMVWYQTDYWKFSCQWCHPMPFYWSLWENWHWQAQQCSTSWTLATKNSVITARNKNKKVCAQGVLQGVMYTYDYIWTPYKLWKYTYTLFCWFMIK